MAKSHPPGSNPSLSAGVRDKFDALQAWKQDVLKWYPQLHERAYFVPPVYMKRINYDLQHIADQPVAVPKAAVKAAVKQTLDVSESDEMEDCEQQRVLHCLKKFCEKRSAPGSKVPEDTDTDGEVMFVLSQLKFTSYLGEPCFAAAARTFPRPIDLKKQNQDRGDFDILVIHRHYGLLTAEIKSVGTYSTGKPGSQAEEDRSLLKRLQQAIKQLNKSDDVLKYLTSDMHSQPRINKTLLLPNISSTQLQRVLEDNPKIKKELCTCFGILDTNDPGDFCLTSDQFSDRHHFWDVTDDVMNGLDRWWTAVMTSKGKDPVMAKQVYEDLVARFAGPATTVEVFCPSALSKASKVVRTEGEAVSETAARCMDLVLHQEQIKILNSGEHLVYLTGPPGTGKTVVLMLQAEQWLNDGHEVHVVSMYNESNAAALLMFCNLQAKCPKLGHNIHLHFYKSGGAGIDETVGTLAACAEDGHLYVVVDEVDGSLFTDFFDKLLGRIKILHLWAARIFYNDIPPCITEFSLTVPLRSPAAVTREVQKSDFVQKYGAVREYAQNVYPHTDGPLIRELRHQGPDHPHDVMPRDCEACGIQLASALVELHVGIPDTSNQTSACVSPDPLMYRDVFLLCINGFTCHSPDESGEATGTCGIINGLQKSGIPVTVLSYNDTFNRSTLMTTLATMQGPDSVIATDCQCVAGLERKIVSWVQPAESDSMLEHFDRLLAFSRTSGQLITITTPPDANPAQMENPGSLLKENLETKSEEEMMAFEKNIEDVFIELGKACLTENIVREVNTGVQISVTHRNGEEHSIFVNMQLDGGSVERGGKSPRGCSTAGHIRLLARDFSCFLRSETMAMSLFQGYLEGRIKIEMRDSVGLLRCNKFFVKIRALYKERYGGKKYG